MPTLSREWKREKTQNSNECLHSVIWSRCPFIGKHKLHGAAASAVAVFNEGSIQLSQVMERLAIETNQIHNLLMDEMDRKRMYKANIASSSRVRKERADRWVKQRQQLATQEASEGTTYAAGEF